MYLGLFAIVPRQLNQVSPIAEDDLCCLSCGNKEIDIEHDLDERMITLDCRVCHFRVPVRELKYYIPLIGSNIPPLPENKTLVAPDKTLELPARSAPA